MASIYFTMAFIAWLLAYFAVYRRPCLEDANGQIKKERYRTLFFLTLVILVFVFSAFRQVSASAIDEYVYRRRIAYMQRLSFREVFDQGYEPLIAVVFWLASRLFSTNQGGLILTSAIVIVPFFVAFRRYALNFSYAVMLLFVTGILYSSFNGVAQYMATAVYLFAIPYIIKKDFKRYILIVALCCMLHTASVVLIPVYFIALWKPGTMKSLLVYAVGLAVIDIAYKNLSTIIETYDILTDYSEIAVNGHHGVNPITIFIACVPAIVALVIGRRCEYDPVTCVSANLCLIHMIIYLGSYLDVYIARFGIFTAPFTILFLSRATQYLNQKNRMLLMYASTLLYGIVCYLSIKGSGYVFNFSL